MVYLGLQDDDEYAGYDQYGYAPHEDDGYGPGPAPGPDEHYAHDGHQGPGPGDYAEVGAPSRTYPESRDVRPLRDVDPTPAPRPQFPGEPSVRPIPRDEPPSGVTVTRPAVVRAVPTTAARVHVVEPHGFNDAPEIGDRVKENQAVILNLQGASRELQRRLIDFSSGLAFAVGGSMSRVAESVFLITPLNVKLSEEEKERLQAKGLYRRD